MEFPTLFVIGMVQLTSKSFAENIFRNSSYLYESKNVKRVMLFCSTFTSKKYE